MTTQKLKTDKAMTTNRSSAFPLGGYIQLMLEFLKWSPSYALAHRLRTNQISKTAAKNDLARMFGAKTQPRSGASNTKRQLWEDFLKVLQTYDDFGDVYTPNIEQWWEVRGKALFTIETAKPKVHQVGRIEPKEDFEMGFVKSLQRHFEVTRPKEGNATELILTVPLGQSRRSLMKQIGMLIDRAKVPVKPRSKKPKRTFAAIRLRHEPLLMYLRVMKHRKDRPELKLWELGALADVSADNKEGLTGKNVKATSMNRDQRLNMASLTSRALKRGKLVAENAARGEFPLIKNRAIPGFEGLDRP